MEQSELVRKVAGELDRLGARYFITGSIATISYGEPRLTNDIDVVVDLSLDQVDAFLLLAAHFIGNTGLQNVIEQPSHLRRSY